MIRSGHFGCAWTQDSSGVWPLKRGRIGCLETSVTDYQSTWCNIRDERKSQELVLMKIHVNGKMILKWMGKVQWRPFAVITHSLIARLTPGLGFIKQSNIICHMRYCFIHGYVSELLSHVQWTSRKLDWYMKVLSPSVLLFIVIVFRAWSRFLWAKFINNLIHYK